MTQSAYPPHLLFVGATTFATAVIVHCALEWRASHPSRETMVVDVVAEDAAGVVEEILRQWPFVGDVVRLQPGPADLVAYLHDRPAPPRRAYFCHRDEVQASTDAIRALAVWGPAWATVVVRLNGMRERGQFDQYAGAVRVVEVPSQAADAARRAPDVVELIAESVQRSMKDKVRVPRQNPAEVHDVIARLLAVGVMVTSTPSPGIFALRDADAVRLAEVEHERWRAERRAAGWRYGPERNNGRKKDPALVAWSDLPQLERDVTLATVQDLVAAYRDALAEFGLDLVAERG
jgi:hypothetical protein